ncbi:MAG: hypothetical protein E6G97_18740 [Alphaproteobacteria bacterium]|nr:MAG: hypothetical protein E6G97_18740 [Alphaproteobacteria bacterium]
MFNCKVLKHSRPPEGLDLISIEWDTPRVVLAEAVTHRRSSDVFGDFELVYAERTTTQGMSKNSASSRAIPLWKIIKKAMDDTYVPQRFSSAGKGMQGAGWLEGKDHEIAVKNWLRLRDQAVVAALSLLNGKDCAETIQKAGLHLRFIRELEGLPAPDVSVHKQDVNRCLEPWLWVTQAVTATMDHWSNFFHLRCHRAAHPALRKLARMAFLAIRGSKPQQLARYQWHLPYDDGEAPFWAPNLATIWPGVALDDIHPRVRASAARCAWVSYENPDKEATQEACDNTFTKLVGSSPLHASPQEHQACPPPPSLFQAMPQYQSNLTGWLQARKLLPREAVKEYSPSDELVASWGPDLMEDGL